VASKRRNPGSTNKRILVSFNLIGTIMCLKQKNKYRSTPNRVIYVSVRSTPVSVQCPIIGQCSTIHAEQEVKELSNWCRSAFIMCLIEVRQMRQRSKVVRSVQVSIHHKSRSEQKYNYYDIEVLIKMTYIISTKSEAEHKYIIKRFRVH
jgi:hypothetical protein